MQVDIVQPKDQKTRKPENRQRSLSFSTLRKANVARCEQLWHGLSDWSESDWLAAVTGELGELAGLIKHQKRGDVIKQRDIANEFADVVIYLDLLAARMGVDLGQAVIDKFNVTSTLEGSDIKLRSK